MKGKSSHKLSLLALVVPLGVLSLNGAEEGLVREESGGAWHFRVGPVMAPRVRAKVSGPRVALPTPSASTTAGRNESVAADPSAGYVAREYADGYVRPDDGTADGGTIVSGLTWDWGADDVGAQHAGDRMEFRTDMARWTETVTPSTDVAGTGAESDRDILLGVEAMGGWMFHSDETFDVSLDGGFRFYGSGDLSARSRQGATVTTTRNEYRYVDSYDASGWVEVPSGSHAGTPTGPDRVIGAAPTRREELMGSTTTTETYYRQEHTKLDYKIWDLRLGPTFGWNVTDAFSLRGGVYGLLGIVDAELDSVVDQDGDVQRSRKSKSEPVFGMAVGLSAQVRLTEKLFLFGSAEYDWWTDSVNLSSGGADARIELSDLTVALALGIEF